MERERAAKLLARTMRGVAGRGAVDRWFGGCGIILTFHRVISADNQSTIDQNRRLEVTPEQFEKIIRWTIDRSYRPASLFELCGVIRNGSEHRTVCFTFDDGYVDNLQYALPILERYGVPATIFVSTDMPDGKLLIWWYALERVLKDASSIRFAHRQEAYELSTETHASKVAAFAFLRQLIQDGSPQEGCDLLEQLGVPPAKASELCMRLSLTWEQIRFLAAHPLITIGAHTVTHPKLTTLTDAELRAELEDSRWRLEREIGGPVEFLAYPFGAAGTCGRREFEAAERVGYTAACTTRPGNILPVHAGHMWALPRYNHSVASCDFDLADLAARIDDSVLLRPGRGW